MPQFCVLNLYCLYLLLMQTQHFLPLFHVTGPAAEGRKSPLLLGKTFAVKHLQEVLSFINGSLTMNINSKLIIEQVTYFSQKRNSELKACHDCVTEIIVQPIWLVA